MLGTRTCAGKGWSASVQIGNQTSENWTDGSGDHPPLYRRACRAANSNAKLAPYENPSSPLRSAGDPASSTPAVRRRQSRTIPALAASCAPYPICWK